MKSTINKFSKFRDDITNQELWFEHMAEQGYILESYGVILTLFVKSDPMILKYKVVVREEIDLFGEEELLEHKVGSLCAGELGKVIFLEVMILKRKVIKFIYIVKCFL